MSDETIAPAAGVTPDPASQWGPGSPAAVERGCLCDPPVVHLVARRDDQPHRAEHPLDVAMPALCPAACPVHGYDDHDGAPL